MGPKGTWRKTSRMIDCLILFSHPCRQVVTQNDHPDWEIRSRARERLKIMCRNVLEAEIKRLCKICSDEREY